MGKNIRLSNYYSSIILKLIFFISAFLFSVQLMVISFKFLNTSLIEHIIIATSNPFVSLFIGLLITAMLQSSSTTTTMIVAIVASGTITIENAVFMVMGANIGTTVTSTLVSLGHITRKKEFRKAIAAATLHDFFNILTALIVLPLEYYFGILSGLSLKLSSLLTFHWDTASLAWESSKELLEPATLLLYQFIKQFALLALLISVFLLFTALHLISRTFRQLILDQYPSSIEKYAFRSPLRSLFIGAAVTGALQSSSLVTSLVVPIVANNRLSLRSAFPFIMGANIGTTLTALIAAIPSSEAALSIALAHLLFNIIGVLIFFPFKALNQIPINIARSLGRATLRNRMIGFVYVILTFFIIPFFLIFLSRGSVHIKQYTCSEIKNTPLIQKAELGLSASLPNRLIYKQEVFSNGFSFENRPDTELYLSRNKDTIMINQQRFLLRNIGFCWQDADEQDQYTICVKAILKKYTIHPSLKIDSCFVYTKRYHNPKRNLFIHKIYLDIHTSLPVKYEVLNQDGVLLGREELMSIVQQ